MPEHPFKPGVEVLVHSGYSGFSEGTFAKDTVLKLHKTGRFTLKGDPTQQWAALNYREDGWRATQTGRSSGWGYSRNRATLRIFDAAAQKEWDEVKAARAHKVRCDEISDFFKQPGVPSHDFSERVMQQIRAFQETTKP